MTRARSTFFVSVAACLIAGTTLLFAQKPADPLDALFARGKAMQKEMTSISATFTETTVSTLLKDPIVARGTVIAAMPLRVLMSYKTPDVKYILLDEKTMVLATPAKHERQEINIADAQKRVQKYFVDASPKDLRSSFAIALAPDPPGGTVDLMDMTPTRKQIKEGLSRLRLWIDRERLVMTKMRMDMPSGDTRTIELSDIKTNVPIDATTFTLPAGGR
jgi:outer membrane lipoprotein-sorting protein